MQAVDRTVQKHRDPQAVTGVMEGQAVAQTGQRGEPGETEAGRQVRGAEQGSRQADAGDRTEASDQCTLQQAAKDQLFGQAGDSQVDQQPGQEQRRPFRLPAQHARGQRQQWDENQAGA